MSSVSSECKIYIIIVRNMDLRRIFIRNKLKYFFNMEIICFGGYNGKFRR